MPFGLSFFLVILIAIIIISRGSKVIREDHRVVIFRLGRFLRIAGPGIVFVFPFIDEAHRIDLNKSVPQWLSMPKEQLDEQLKNMVLSGTIHLQK